jgi:hypothetical protein
MLAAEKYNLHGVQLYLLGSVRRGGKIPPMWNVPFILYQSTLVHRMLRQPHPFSIGSARDSRPCYMPTSWLPHSSRQS